MAGTWDEGSLGRGASCPAEGADDAIPAWAADQCDTALGREASAGEGKLNMNLGRVSKGRELEAWETFKVSEPVTGGVPRKATLDAR